MSLNPAIDNRLRLKRLQLGRVNRATEVRPAPGGKATHVAMVLRTLGADPLWLGFAGGAAGSELLEGLRALSIRVEAVPVAGTTRTNLKILEDEGKVTEILEPGPVVKELELERLESAYLRLLDEAAVRAFVILSGSLPAGVPEDYYTRLIALAHQRKCIVLVDTSGVPLRLAVKAHPDLVKPNQEEAAWLSGSTINGVQSAAAALRSILAGGASRAAISLGAKGLLFQAGKERDVLLARGPKLPAQSSVGSGDAALAGFAFAVQEGMSAADSVLLAAACGAANCLADGPGQARMEDIRRLKEQIQVGLLQ